MRLLSVRQFPTAEGTEKETVIPLSPQPGVYYKICSNTYYTPYFTTDNTIVPVVMQHDDRAPENVTIRVNNGMCYLKQLYQQAQGVFIFEYVNDNWVTPNEYRIVNVAPEMIKEVQIASDAKWRPVYITHDRNGVNYILSIPELNHTTKTHYVRAIKTKDNNIYKVELIFEAAVVSTNPTVYGIPEVTVNFMITAATNDALTAERYPSNTSDESEDQEV